MRKLVHLSTIVLLFAGQQLLAQNVNIPDAIFKAELVANTAINTNMDTEIQVSEANAYNGTIVLGHNVGITDLTGLEAFVNITEFTSTGNFVTTVDFSTLVALERLIFTNAQITSLDLSSNVVLDFVNLNFNSSITTYTFPPSVTSISARHNGLSTVDLSQLSGLRGVNFSVGSLTALDVSNNPELLNIDISNNDVSSLDLSNNPDLLRLTDSNSDISEIDVSNNPKLIELIMTGGGLETLDLRNNPDLQTLHLNDNNLTSLDLTNNPDLQVVWVNNNDLNYLNVKNGNSTSIMNFRSADNPDLACINVDDVTYSTTNWTNIDAGTSFSTDCNVYIPDANFKAALIANTNINSNMDTEIQYSEAYNYDNSLVMINAGISDATGIAAFVNTNQLTFQGNSLTSVDVRNNKAVTRLNFELNDLAEIDVTQNPLLRDLLLQGNELTSINLSQNPLLRYLRIHNNDLSTIDLSQNPVLNELVIGGNDNLTSIDLSDNPGLIILWASTHNFTSLDLSNNTQLSSLWMSNGPLTELDLSAQTDLTSVQVYGNSNLTSLDLRNFNTDQITTFNSLNTPNLTCIAISDPEYATANFTNVDGANSFVITCDLNEFINFPDENFETALLANGSLNTIDDGGITYAEAQAYAGAINVGDQMISDLTGIEILTNITSLSAEDNSLTAIDLSKNVDLFQVDLGNNQLDELDVSNNIALTNLDVTGNQLTSIDLTSLSLLETLTVEDNQLTSLNTSGNPLLEQIESGENMINSLDLSDNPELTSIQTHQNELNALDVSNNPKLFRITAFTNNITEIDLSNNPLLTSVSLEDNQLTEIDVTSLPILTNFRVRNNNLSSVNMKNGNNASMTTVLLDFNPDLFCVLVDDPVFSEANWDFVDDQTIFSSTDCSPFSGTYLIGEGEEYETLTEILTDMRSLGMDADVNLELKDGYSGTGFSITKQIPGAGEHSLSIYPESGATSVEIEKAFQPFTTSLIRSLDFHDFTISGKAGGTGDMVLTMKATSVGSEVMRIGEFVGQMTFEGIKFDFKSMGINLNGPMDEVIIKDCEFFSTAEAEPNSPTGRAAAVFQAGTIPSVSYLNNRVFYTGEGATGNFYGFEAQGNGTNTYINNSIIVSVSSAADLVGIQRESSTDDVLHHNSIFINGNVSSMSAGLNIFSTSGASIINNQIRSDVGSGGDVDYYGVRLASNEDLEFESNNISSTSYYISYQGGTYDDLAELLMDVPALASNTESQPEFGMIESGSLELTGASLEDDEMFSSEITGVETDIEGNPRSIFSPTKGAYEVPRSGENDIVTFEVDDRVGDAIVDTDNHTVVIRLSVGSSVSSISPTIAVSDDADVDPATGVSRDFSDEVEYTVTAEDGAPQVWTVTISVNRAPEVANSLDDQDYINGFDSDEIDFGSVFEDADGDELSFSVDSDDEDVVTVEISNENLVITEVGPGTATVTLTADDGFDGATSLEFEVTVTGPDFTLIGDLEDLLVGIGFGDQPIDLDEIFADLTGATITAESSNPNVITVTIDGTEVILTEVGSGTTTITITVDDGSGNSVSLSFDVTVDTTVAGIGNQLEHLLSVYPNPAVDEVQVDLGEPGFAKAQLYDANGRAVGQVVQFEGQTTLDLRQYQTGTYLLKLYNDFESATTRILIRR